MPKESWSSYINFWESRLQNKKIIMNKEKNYIMKESVLQGTIIIFDVYTSYNGSSKCLRQKMIELQWGIDKLLQSEISTPVFQQFIDQAGRKSVRM